MAEARYSGSEDATKRYGTTPVPLPNPSAPIPQQPEQPSIWDTIGQFLGANTGFQSQAQGAQKSRGLGDVLGGVGNAIGGMFDGGGGLPGPKINMPNFPGPKVNLPGPTVGQVWDTLYNHFTGPTQKLLGRDKKKGGGDASIPAAGADTPATSPAPASDPNALALQMFFTSTIAPYLNQLAGQMKESGANYATALEGVQGQLNPAVRPYFNPAARQAQVNQQANAMAATAVAAPQLDQLLSSINQAAEMQRFLAYQQMQNQATGNSLGQLGDIVNALQGGKQETSSDAATLQAEMAKRAGS